VQGAPAWPPSRFTSCLQDRKLLLCSVWLSCGPESRPPPSLQLKSSTLTCVCDADRARESLFRRRKVLPTKCEEVTKGPDQVSLLRPAQGLAFPGLPTQVQPLTCLVFLSLLPHGYPVSAFGFVHSPTYFHDQETKATTPGWH
jgi:hypothetical protein